MNPNLPQQTPRRGAFTAFALVYILASALYLTYGGFTDTGLSGWLMDWQMRHFGGADNRVTILGNGLVWLISLAPVFYALMRLNRAEGFTPAFLGQQPPVGGQPALTYQQHQADIYSLRNRATFAALSAAVSVGAFFYLSWADDHLAAQPVVRLDLNQATRLPANTELASIHGVLAASFGFALKETKYGRSAGTTTYAPLLPASWQPGQPVQFVVKTKVPVYQHPFTKRVFVLDSGQVFSATYDGRLSANDAPTYVSQHLAAQQLTLTNPYYVLDDQEVNNGYAVLPDADRRWLLPGCGLVLAIVMLVRNPTRAQGRTRAPMA